MNEGPIETLFATQTPARLGPEVRDSAWSGAEASALAAEFCDAAGVTGRAAGCLRALVLVWHDHFDDAHGIVQDLADADAAWVHGIIHRREPDYSNARYWFQRVGVHPAFEPLAEAAAPMLAARAALPRRLIRNGRWDPFAFIDAVSAASRLPVSAPEPAVLEELQGIEVLALARYLAAPGR